jgi:endonuclease/exonuclease/phosphatase family metal-dependent hydrolase
MRKLWRFPSRLGAGVLLLTVALIGCTDSGGESSPAASDTLRVLTYNVEDVRTQDLRDADHLRLTGAAARIQHLRPDILLFNEMTYDQPGSPGYRSGDPEGQNARRFAERFLATAQADSLEGIRYEPVMLPTNTGLPSGLDLNNDGRVVTTVPDVPAPPPSGAPAPQTDAGRAYGGDAWGFGTFPGQYGMALFVREDLTVVRDSIRTFRLLEWNRLPDAAKPVDPDSGTPWYNDTEWAQMRLSSKNHWDVPVRTPSGRTLHVLASHPTPPGFDGPADRNGRRNHDEIRLWTDYLSGADYVQDDSGRAGGLAEEAAFVVMGDQNADPEGDARGSRAIQALMDHPRVQGAVTPTASAAGQAAFPDLDPEDTSPWGARIDYVLPSAGLSVTGHGVWRPVGRDTSRVPVSDHFPVWVDVVVEP